MAQKRPNGLHKLGFPWGMRLRILLMRLRIFLRIFRILLMRLRIFRMSLRIEFAFCSCVFALSSHFAHACSHFLHFSHFAPHFRIVDVGSMYYDSRNRCTNRGPKRPPEHLIIKVLKRKCACVLSQ